MCIISYFALKVYCNTANTMEIVYNQHYFINVKDIVLASLI